MTTVLSNNHSKATQPRVRHFRTGTSRSHDPIPVRCQVTRAVTEVEEAAMVAKYVYAFAMLGVTPLIVFLIIHNFFPDLLLFLGRATQ